MHALTLEQLEQQADSFDELVATMPGIDHFCSSSAWILPAQAELCKCIALLVGSGMTVEEAEPLPASALQTAFAAGIETESGEQGGLIVMDLAEMFRQMGDLAHIDPSRVVEGIVGGIGFLGTGAIIQSRGAVKGLTTGANMWLAGALGDLPGDLVLLGIEIDDARLPGTLSGAVEQGLPDLVDAVLAELCRQVVPSAGAIPANPPGSGC